MYRAPPKSKRTDTLFPDTTIFPAPANRLGVRGLRSTRDSGVGANRSGHIVHRALIAVHRRRATEKLCALRVQLSQIRCAVRLIDAAAQPVPLGEPPVDRSEEHTSELQSLMRISYAVFCLKKK